MTIDQVHDAKGLPLHVSTARTEGHVQYTFEYYACWAVHYDHLTVSILDDVVTRIDEDHLYYDCRYL
jgi:hypothetical protein